MKEYRNISTLKNWDKNPRSIKDKDFDRLKKQIYNLGQYKPLLITEDGTVLGGNMRLRAYKELGIDEIWVSVVDAPTEEKKLEYALSDNDRAGYYDSDLLANLIPEYPDFEWGSYAVDLGEPQTLDKLLDQFQEAEEDEAPQVSDEPAVSKLGEVYQLGRHRLMCGDATKIEDVEKLMNGQKADMVFTDPPYGMDLDTDYSQIKPSSAAYKSFAQAKGETTNKNYSRVIGDDKDFDPTFLFEKFADVKEMFLWGADYYAERLQNKNEGSWIVWDKRTNDDGSNLDAMFGSLFELCWSKNKHKREIARVKYASLFGTEREDVKQRLHPTQKPILLADWFIKRYSEEGWNIVDLFGGSGSTLIAAEQTNRTCYMMELDPKYVDVIRKRYAKFINQEENWEDITKAIV